MNKDDAQLIIEKERLKKERIQKRMHEYRTNSEFRKKNANYMKDYRIKQKTLLETANKIINNESKEKDKEKKITENSDKKKQNRKKLLKNILVLLIKIINY